MFEVQIFEVKVEGAVNGVYIVQFFFSFVEGHFNNFFPCFGNLPSDHLHQN